AFKPFNYQSINFSEEVLHHIIDVDKFVIDVIYDESYMQIKEQKNLEEYDLIIALGEARSRTELTLELQAKNISSCSLKDNKGILKTDEIINPTKDEILKTQVDIEKCKDDITLSYDAGKFVCNNLYFHLLEEYPAKSLFIHIPLCYSQDDYKKHANQINKIIDKLDKKN
ncbi:MAG: hypothetical protein ACI4U5_05820, partial [Bacilli bacterium]